MSVLPRRRRALGPSAWRDWVRRYETLAAGTLTLLALALILLHQSVMHGSEWSSWDVLFVSGSLTTLVGLWIARGHPERFQAMLQQLVDRGALVREEGATVSRDELEQIKRETRQEGARWGIFVGLVLGAIVAAAFVAGNAIRTSPQPRLDELLGPLVGAVAGFVVGRVLGRMLFYSLLGRELRKRHLRFAVSAGHLDAVGGLKPLGDYYLVQALLLGLPAVYLLAWSLLMTDSDLAERYASWREMYLVFLALAILLEIIGFLAPLIAAHGVMEREKARLLSVADTEVRARFESIREELRADIPDARRTQLQGQLQALREQYQEAETMPTWPIDRTLRRRVTIANVALVVPLVGQVVELGW